MKIRRIGWTHLIVNKEGKNYMRLVRKSIFDGYVVIIDASGKKEKRESLRDLDTLEIKGSFWTLFPRLDISSLFVREFDKNQHALSVRGEKIAELRKSINALRTECQAKDAKIEAMDKSEKNRLRDILTRRQSYLMDGFNEFGVIQYHREWEVVSFCQPNALQASIGLTCVPQTEYNEDDYESKYDMRHYLDVLSKKAPSEFKEQVSMLIVCYNDFMGAYNAVSAEDDVSYNNALLAKIKFINRLRDFLYLYRSKEGPKDIDYFWSNTAYGRGDEKDTTKAYSYRIVSQGEDACAHLIEQIYGKEESTAFIEEIKRLSGEGKQPGVALQ